MPMRGLWNRCYLRDFSYSPSGSLSIANLAQPLVAANMVGGSAWDFVDIDDGVQVRRTQNTTNGAFLYETNLVTGAVNGAIYGARNAARHSAKNLARVQRFFARDTGTLIAFSTPSVEQTDDWYQVSPIMALGATIQQGIADQPLQSVDDGFSSFDWIHNAFARAFLVDNNVNAFQRSDDFGNAYWTTTNLTVTSDAGTSPNGTATSADRITDDATSGTHDVRRNVTVSATVGEFYTLSVFVQAETRDLITLRADDTVGTNQAVATFNLTSEAQSTSQAGGFDQPQSRLEDWGSNWYRCVLTFRKNTSDTTMRCLFMMNNGSGTTYVGSGETMLLWGAQLQQGLRAGRYVRTTDASAAELQQASGECWLKGMPDSQDNILRAGDQLEINGQLVRLTAPLYSDASGSGLAQFEPRLRSAPADDSAVMLHEPHGKFLLARASNGWSSRPGVFSDLTLEFVEDIAA